MMVRDVVIVGGGTAGWMTAAALAKFFGSSKSITLVESETIATIGVGEATVPPLRNFHRELGIPEQTLLTQADATYKLGIRFEGWGAPAGSYMHTFGVMPAAGMACDFHQYWQRASQLRLAGALEDYLPESVLARRHKFSRVSRQLNYAYHLDAGRYASILKRHAVGLGVKCMVDTVQAVNLDSDTGQIQSLLTASGRLLSGDLFIDCTGFRALMIGQALGRKLDDWSHWLPCDRAWFVQSEALEDLPPYTRCTAHRSGWFWQIPLQQRTGNGAVFASAYDREQTVLDHLLAQLNSPPKVEPQLLRFATGWRPQAWYKNCVAIGLSSGFLEPLESTAIHLIQQAIVALLRLFPQSHEVMPLLAQQFSDELYAKSKVIRNFLIAHYAVNERPEDFWRACRATERPDELSAILERFAAQGNVPHDANAFFKRGSWAQVLCGQGMRAAEVHPFTAQISSAALAQYFARLKQDVDATARSAISHREFVGRQLVRGAPPGAAAEPTRMAGVESP